MGFTLGRFPTSQTPGAVGGTFGVIGADSMAGATIAGYMFFQCMTF